MPKYKEIAIALKKKIVEGEFKEGELLPDQETLAKMYQTSRVTVRKAIQLLIDERDEDQGPMSERISNRTIKMLLKLIACLGLLFRRVKRSQVKLFVSKCAFPQPMNQNP